MPGDEATMNRQRIDSVWFPAMGAAAAMPLHAWAGLGGLAPSYAPFWVASLLLPVVYLLTRNRLLLVALGLNAVVLIAALFLLDAWYVMAAPLVAPVIVAGVRAMTSTGALMRLRPRRHEQFLFALLGSASLMVPIMILVDLPYFTPAMALIPGSLLVVGSLACLFHGSFVLRVTAPLSLFLVPIWNMAPVSMPGLFVTVSALITREVYKKAPESVDAGIDLTPRRA